VESFVSRISWDPVGFLCSLVWFQTSLFRSTVLIIGDGCCSSALVLRSLSMTTFLLSTIYNKVYYDKLWLAPVIARQ
jgi:hypothetical protein